MRIDAGDSAGKAGLSKNWHIICSNMSVVVSFYLTETDRFRVQQGILSIVNSPIKRDLRLVGS